MYILFAFIQILYFLIYMKHIYVLLELHKVMYTKSNTYPWHLNEES
jgi:hypothetical protein